MIKIRIQIVLLLCFGSFLTSCEQEELLDLEGLEWLKAEIAEIEQYSLAEYFYINEAEYQRDRVFVIENCCPFCGTAPAAVFSADGEILGRIGDGIAADDLIEVQLFWQPDDAACFQ